MELVILERLLQNDMSTGCVTPRAYMEKGTKHEGSACTPCLPQIGFQTCQNEKMILYFTVENILVVPLEETDSLSLSPRSNYI